jgi:hypothetical protein
MRRNDAANHGDSGDTITARDVKRVRLVLLGFSRLDWLTGGRIAELHEAFARHFQHRNRLREDGHLALKPAKPIRMNDLRRDKRNRVTRSQTVMRPRRRAFGVSGNVIQILPIDSSLQLCWLRALRWIHWQYPCIQEVISKHPRHVAPALASETTSSR